MEKRKEELERKSEMSPTTHNSSDMVSAANKVRPAINADNDEGSAKKDDFPAGTDSDKGGIRKME